MPNDTNGTVLDPTTKTLILVCGFGRYREPSEIETNANRSRFDTLDNVGPTISRLQNIFESPAYRRSNIQTISYLSGRSAEEIRTSLTSLRSELKKLKEANLILIWCGHGERVNTRLRLATSDCLSPLDDADGLSLNDIAKATGISQVKTWTVFLDACYAGAAIDEAATLIADNMKSDRQNLAGYGALFSASPFAQASDSLFTTTLADVLEQGPSEKVIEGSPQLLAPYGAFNINEPRLDLQEVFKAVRKEFSADPVKFNGLPEPRSLQVDFEKIFLPNPRFIDKSQPELIEVRYRAVARSDQLETHFFAKAVGIEDLQMGWHFSGRKAATQSILAWLKQPVVGQKNALYILVADGGTGKSALLGRLISLSDPQYREKAKSRGWNIDADIQSGTVPEINEIDAALNLRSLTAQATVDTLASLLQLPIVSSPENFIEQFKVHYAAPDKTSPRIVLDSLDESEDPVSIVNRVIKPLVEEKCKVVVATRPSASARGAENILQILGESTVYRLDADVQSTEDISDYVKARLRLSEKLQPLAERAAQIIGGQAENKFLYARTTTSSLLRNAERITSGTLGQFIAKNATEALQKDFDELDVSFRTVFDRTDKGATAILTALAYGQGDGLPTHDLIWARMATAINGLSGPCEPITDLHIEWVIREAGRFILESGDGQQAVYRLFHKSLNDYFQSQGNVSGEEERLVEERIAQVLLQCVKDSKEWQHTNPYLIRHLPAHLAARPKQKGLNNLLINFDWVESRLNASGVDALLKDYDYCESAYPSTARLQRTLSMISHILRIRPEELIPQMLGRIAPGIADITALLNKEQGANYGFALPSDEALGLSERLVLQQQSLDVEVNRLDWIDRTLRLDGFLERARAKIAGPELIPALGGLAQAGALVRVMQDHPTLVNSVAFSGDGRFIVSGSDDNTLRLWDAQSGQSLRVLEGHTNRVISVAFSGDGRFIVSGSWDKTLRLWDAQGGQSLRVLEGHTNRVISVAFSGDGRFIVSGSDDNTLRLWDAQGGQSLRVLEGGDAENGI
jgi:WD domain, G-beta repeat/Caspase domain